MKPMIELLNLEKTYQFNNTSIQALRNINLCVNPGEIFGVIGSSGAGKSTLIRCVNLLEKPTFGKVIIDGDDITSFSTIQLRNARRKIGMIFQHFNLLSSRTVFENIAFPLQLTKMNKTQIKQSVKKLLELTGLSAKQDDYPAQLSGGQKQRVAIARALANQPKILLSDEATSALDPETTHSILQLLKEINQKLGLTILLITHEMQVVKEICHRLAIIEHGQMIEQADTLEFFSNPKSETAKKFIRTSLTHHLPENIRARLVIEQTPESLPLLRISFLGQSSQEPLIAHLIQKYSLNLNILLANIEQIRDETVGIMLLEAEGSPEKIQQGIAYLTQKGVNVEVIGYVSRSY